MQTKFFQYFFQKELSEMLGKCFEKQIQQFLNEKVIPFQMMIEKRTSAINMNSVNHTDKIDSIQKEMLQIQKKMKENNSVRKCNKQCAVPITDTKQTNEDYEGLKDQIREQNNKIEQIENLFEVRFQDAKDQFECLIQQQTQTLESVLKSSQKKIRQEFQEENQDIKLQLIKIQEDFIELVDEKIQDLKLDAFKLEFKETVSDLYKALEKIRILNTEEQKKEEFNESIIVKQEVHEPKATKASQKLWLNPDQLVVQNQSPGSKSEKYRGTTRAFKLRKNLNYSFQNYSLSELQEQLLNLSQARYPLVKSSDRKQRSK